ncbi:DUF1254 domain-containing protein [Mesorhizobium sp. LjRoot246]|uniref:DUF1254 domain-containing protein n=1 Tax=Mesorhizobium sp. LjRoot246 TaxID=3342294 RepID=UPI003ECC355F
MKSQSLVATLVFALAATTVLAQTGPKMKMTTDIPEAIMTPDTVDTRLGTLKFDDGFPDDATVQKVYDNLDFQRGVQAFLTAMPGASLVAMRHSLRELGAVNGNIIPVSDTLLDSKAIWLTPNADTVYAVNWIDLTDGPVVIESPPEALGIFDDFWFHYVADLGLVGPDQGKGGKFLFLPPDYTGEVPKGYHVFKSRTFGNWYLSRGFLVDGSPEGRVEIIKKNTRIYPLSQAANPPEQKFMNLSGVPHNTVHANDFGFFEEVNQLVQDEPSEAMDPETMGLLASIGIEKGKPFAPDARMKKILTEAAAVGNATTRAILMKSRDQATYYYPNSGWSNPLLVGGYEFLQQPAVRSLDSRTGSYYYFTGSTPAMSMKMIGAGSQYAYTFVDSEGKRLDGAKNYKIHLPPNIPAKRFWSIIVYDTQTRSDLQTDQQFPSVGSQKKDLIVNPDSSVDVWFGPTAPAGKEANWIQTIPGKGWNPMLRLYSPLESWFDKTWRPSEVELVQ